MSDIRPETKPVLNLVALLVGEPQAPELWMLKMLASASCTLQVICAQKGTGVGPLKRLRRLLREHGPIRVISRLLGSNLIGQSQQRKRVQVLDQLLDGQYLRQWWRHSGILPIAVPHLNHAVSRATIEALQPDIIVRVSGGILKREIFALARLATLNIHHGQAPLIRGMWSIPWGIVEGRCDWIGASVHVIDDGIDTGRVLWRGTPQLALGDTGDTLFFRAHLQASEALVKIIRDYTQGKIPGFLSDAETSSTYRSAPGVGTWLRYLYLGKGTRARALLESALK